MAPAKIINKVFRVWYGSKPTTTMTKTKPTKTY